MQKIILIIIATIVNQIASGQDQSKLQNDVVSAPVFQYCNGEVSILRITMEATLFCGKDVYSNEVKIALPCDLFVNFNPRFSVIQ
ncbi:hypothetical protein DHD05_16860 [Arenibacter sp. N53]|uniref:hypothetical protein n=1 Tax=Arenibacter TaxID=178469 RepID=UPI000CD46590|nr:MULTISPECIES: hypothetical protein [Arenibacter]MCM4153264.1 hypothetical protein [Arenibacter sp. N53]